MNRNDLHFHLLPGIDDGPATLDESLFIAAEAVSDGTTIAVATPHIRPAYVNGVSELPDRAAELRWALRREGISLQVRLGGELAHGMVGRLRQTSSTRSPRARPALAGSCSRRRSSASTRASTRPPRKCATAGSGC